MEEEEQHDLCLTCLHYEKNGGSCGLFAPFDIVVSCPQYAPVMGWLMRVLERRRERTTKGGEE